MFIQFLNIIDSCVIVSSQTMQEKICHHWITEATEFRQSQNSVFILTVEGGKAGFGRLPHIWFKVGRPDFGEHFQRTHWWLTNCGRVSKSTGVPLSYFMLFVICQMHSLAPVLQWSSLKTLLVWNWNSVAPVMFI